MTEGQLYALHWRHAHRTHYVCTFLDKEGDHCLLYKGHSADELGEFLATYFADTSDEIVHTSPPKIDDMLSLCGKSYVERKLSFGGRVKSLLTDEREDMIRAMCATRSVAHAAKSKL
jgi:hypothetical protein